MGASLSFCVDDDSPENQDQDEGARKNLIFPNEILEKILSFISYRDKLIAREVCLNWMQYINIAGGLQDAVKIRICSDELNYLAGSYPPVFTMFHFHKVDLTRQSSTFWNSYSDIITHLDFYDCAIIPRNTEDSVQAEFTLGCPNLKHLGLINCDKYFLMGGTFIQLNQILCLENLESLNLSRNKNLTDKILFSILLKTKKLQSIDLSDCVNMVFMKAVHSRFYPANSGTDDCIIFSDHILSFHTFCFQFLRTERASHMKKFNFGMKLNSAGMDLILSANEKIRWERVNLESPELKPNDIKNFMTKYQSSLQVVKLGRCKLTSDEIYETNLVRLKEFEVYDTRSITTLKFLASMPKLQYLYLGGLNGFDLRNDAFSNFRSLSVLCLNGIKPTGNRDSCRQEVLQIFKHLHALTALDVGNIPQIVNDEVVQEIIRRFRRLKRLNLESSTITDAGLTGIYNDDSKYMKTNYNKAQTANEDHNSAACLAELTDLEYLNLSDCRELGELTWQRAIRFQNLVSLNLSKCPTLSKRGILSIVKSCRNLEKLILIHCSRQILTDIDVLTTARENLYRCKGITY